MRRLAAFLFPFCIAAAQPSGTAAAAPSFEAASIKPSSPDATSSGVDTDTGLLRIQNQPLRGLIRIAYGVNDAQVTGGPKWVEADRFDIAGKADGPAGGPALLEMLQTLLADRFKLVFHREQRTVTGYALTVAKGGVKMQASDSQGSSSNGGRGRIDAKGYHMSQLAERLTRLLHAPVEDATGTTAGFDFSLRFTPEEMAVAGAAKDDSAPTIFTALQEQLGLKLEARKVQMEVIVIDSAEKPSEN